MPVRDNWASRPHHPPGPDRVVKQHQAMASGIEVDKPPRKTVPPGMAGSNTGAVGTPGWFHTKR